MKYFRHQAISIDGSAEVAFDLIADVAKWSTFMPAVSVSRRVSGGVDKEIIELTAEAGHELITWQSTRTVNRHSRVVTFERIAPKPPFRSMTGRWLVLSRPTGCHVLLEHDYELEDGTGHPAIEAIISRNVTRDLEGLKVVVEKARSAPKPNVIITGGSVGIGLSIAEHFVCNGYSVSIGARDTQRLERAVSRLEALSGKGLVHAHRLDVVDETSTKAFFEWAFTRDVPPSILVNNAGVGGGGRTLSLPGSTWNELMDCNLHGLYRCCVEFLARLSAAGKGWGRIINIASTGGKQGIAFGAAYSASKHGVVGLTKALGLEYAKSGITVNAVCPGFVETELAAGTRQRYASAHGFTLDEARAHIEGRVPIGRYIEVNEVANAVLFFAGQEANGVTAQTLNVCGGLGNY
ncbi:SDR family NAD(P)-dependent oxidoreductase [Allorhizobium pseudoryzae]|uniref:SDR family NAD(P)-dependent oxidoreductase n=1 Tax=Allorhizobium pseudoryzae TaxID=379684 RepID=UPI003D05B21F